MGLLNEKVAIVTGSGSGLGKATAIAFAREGASVVLCGRRAEKIGRTADEIHISGGTAAAIPADVSSEQQVNELVEQTLRRFGRIDILINNAAVFVPNAVHETPLDLWNYHLHNNATSVLLTMRACIPVMRSQKYGRIINITSGFSQNGAYGYAAYGASKAAMETLTRSAAAEESERGILINLFDPGVIKTEMHATGEHPDTAVPHLLKLAAMTSQNGFYGKKLTRDEARLV